MVIFDVSTSWRRGWCKWAVGFVTAFTATTGIVVVAAPPVPPVAATPGHSCAPLDVVLVIDSSTSMDPAIENVKSQTAALLDRIVTESGGDYRIGLVDFADDVQVRVLFAPKNAEQVRAVIPELYQDRNNTEDPEAWDEALVTVVDGRTAAEANSTRSDSDGQQTGDFVADWRAEAKKIVLLVTDATAGGFDGQGDPSGADADARSNPPVRFNRAFSAAVRANAQGIRIATVFVPNANSEPDAEPALASIANETGAPTVRTLPDGSNLDVGLDLFVSTCATDSDGDGLYDTWETGGYDADDDGVIDVDLPAMGADPQRKDLFIQVNWMSPDGAVKCYFFVYCPGRSDGPHPPNRQALAKIKEMFAEAPVSNPDGSKGITVHFDAGGLEPDGTALGGASKAGGPIPVHFGLPSPQDDYGAFSERLTGLRDTFVDDARNAVFTWVLYAHDITGLAGTSAGVPGDTAVISGVDVRGNTAYEASTFAHELGHTLGLRHGGYNDINFKPNLLSVMNYGFARQSGLIRNGEENIVDYSRFDLTDLDPQNLSEPDGVTAKTDTENPAGYKTLHPCPDEEDEGYVFRTTDLAPIDWNCNESTTDTDVSLNSSIYGNEILAGRDEWATITFTGGERGGLEDTGEPPDETGFNRAAYDELNHKFALDVTGPGAVSTEPAAQLVRLPFTVTNVGTTKATWTAATSTTGDWKPTVEPVDPATIEPGATERVDVDLSVPENAKAGTSATVTLSLTGDEPGNDGGSATATVALDGAATVEPTGELSVSPSEPEISSKFSVSGSGFEAGTSVVITSTNSDIGPLTATTNGEGVFDVDLEAPPQPATVSVVALGQPQQASSRPSTTTSSNDDPMISTVAHTTQPLVLGTDVKVVAAPEQRASRPSEAQKSGGSSPLLWVAIATAVVVLAAGAVWLIVVSQRHRRLR